MISKLFKTGKNLFYVRKFRCKKLICNKNNNIKEAITWKHRINIVEQNTSTNISSQDIAKCLAQHFAEVYSNNSMTKISYLRKQI